MREVLYENIEWNVKEMEHSALRLVGFYRHALEMLGTKRWVKFAVDNLVPAIREPRINPVSLGGEAFDLEFYGPYQIPQQIEEEGRIVITTIPRFEIKDRTYLNLSPKMRGLLYRTNNEISAEMREVYGLEISHDPLVLIYPKENYALKVTRAKFGLINAA